MARCVGDPANEGDLILWNDPGETAVNVGIVEGVNLQGIAIRARVWVAFDGSWRSFELRAPGRLVRPGQLVCSLEDAAKRAPTFDGWDAARGWMLDLREPNISGPG